MTTEPVKVDTQRPPPLERKTYWCIHCGELYQRPQVQIQANPDKFVDMTRMDAPAVCEDCLREAETGRKR